MFSCKKPLSHHVKSALTAVAAAACLGLALPGTVQALDNPFGAMAGSWSGSGVITTSNGNKERIRCRAQSTTSMAPAPASI